MGNPESSTIGMLKVSDVTGQKLYEAHGVPSDSSIGELVQGLLVSMGLPRTDVAGRPLLYQALSETQGRHLHAAEIVGETLQSDEKIVLQPNIDAGCTPVSGGHETGQIHGRSRSVTNNSV